MRRRGFLLVFSLTLAVGSCLLTGCATMSDVLHERQTGGGTTAIYPVDLDQASEIARAVFQWEVGEPIDSHRDQGYLLTSTPTDLFSWGTVMGAWIEDAGVGKSKVTVVTKRRYAMSWFTTLTEGGFHRRFVQAVAILESGDSLPKKAPRYGRQEVAK